MTTRWNDSTQAVNDQFDICVFGTEKTGKSSFILHFIKGCFIKEVDPCVEEIYTKIIPTDDGFKEYTILDSNATDVDYYASSIRKQVQNTISMILVYAINNRDSFEALEDIYDRINSIRDGEMPPIILVGLKSDLNDEIQVDYYEGKEFSERINAINFTECSAKLNIGIEETFEPLIREIEHVKELEALQKTDSDSVFSSKTMEDTHDLPEAVVHSSSSTKELAEYETCTSNIEKLSKTYNDKESKFSKSSKSSKSSESSRSSSSSKKSQEDTTSFRRREVRTFTRDVSSKSLEKKSSSKCCIIV